jgi:hypothetical protein
MEDEKIDVTEHENAWLVICNARLRKFNKCSDSTRENHFGITLLMVCDTYWFVRQRRHIDSSIKGLARWDAGLLCLLYNKLLPNINTRWASSLVLLGNQYRHLCTVCPRSSYNSLQLRLCWFLECKIWFLLSETGI